MTKKVKIIISSVCAAVLLFIIILVSAISCNNKKSNDTPSESTHTHTYATAWTSDETKHWHASSCGHDVKSSEAKHTLQGGICSVCGYNAITEGIEYTLSDDGEYYIVSGVEEGKELSGEVVIAGTYNGKPVTSVGPSAFYQCKNITSVILPDSITSIEQFAFQDCTSLLNITIPNGVTSIGDQAFNYCYDLLSISLPDSITSIGQSAFEDCMSLRNVNIPSSLTTLAESVFEGCESLTSITIPESVTYIDNFAFYDCHRLVEVINKSKINITKGSSDNSYAGDNALNIKTEGTSDIVNINDYLFYTVDNTNYLVSYIGDETSLVLPRDYNGQTYQINAYAFIDLDITSVTIPNGVTSIGECSFQNCGSIVNLIISDSVDNIDDSAFSCCDSLESVILSKNVRKINDNVFEHNVSLKALYYSGTKQEYDSLTIGSYNDLSDATVYYYSETNPTDTTYKYWHYVDNVATIW